MPAHPIKLAAAVAAYVAAVIAANVLTDLFREVPVYGTPFMVTAGTYAAGFALLARDFVHRFGGWQVALAAILAAGILSWQFASPALAVASTVAFLGAELIDLLVFGPVRDRHGFATGVIVSNVVSAPIDTFIFLTLAGFPITFELVAGQLVGKIMWATLVPLALYLAARRGAVRLHRVRATDGPRTGTYLTSRDDRIVRTAVPVECRAPRCGWTHTGLYFANETLRDVEARMTKLHRVATFGSHP